MAVTTILVWFGMTDYRLEFGWEGDGGLGERLIREIMDGEKTATCAPRSDYTEEELAEVAASQGEIKQDHREAWSAEMEVEGNPLSDDTILVVEEFELVEVLNA